MEPCRAHAELLGGILYLANISHSRGMFNLNIVIQGEKQGVPTETRSGSLPIGNKKVMLKAEHTQMTGMMLLTGNQCNGKTGTLNDYARHTTRRLTKRVY